MKTTEELLQERIEQLEAGAPLEHCLAGLSEEEAACLRTAAQLICLEGPVQRAEAIFAQRAQVIQAQPPPDQAMRTTASAKLARLSLLFKENIMNQISADLRSFWKAGYRLPFLFAGAASLVLCLAVFFISASFFMDRGSQAGGPLAQVFGGKTLAVNRPTESVVQELRGVVEVAQAEGAWQMAQTGSVLEEGMRLRTGLLSGATLAFYDGSFLTVGPQAELVIDQLKAGKGSAERVIVLTQIAGESEHSVARSTHPGSRYAVLTASGAAEARGTKFKVSINMAEGTLVQVSEGKVSVSGSGEMVLVESGQAAMVSLDQPPSQPAYFFTGQGPVTIQGSTWVIDGQVLSTHAGTVVIGNPLVGDEVFFQGRLLEDSTRTVDLIVLLRRSPANRFSMTGFVEQIEPDFWTIHAQLVAVTDITLVDPDIEEGDLVEVSGVIMSDGTLQAETIRRLEEAPGLPFDFTGVLQSLEPDPWRISGVEVAVSASTQISQTLAVGDLVRVTGWIVASGEWQAERIQRVLDETQAFEFTGPIETIDPWVVAGIPFETREWTVIEAGLEAGEQVRVTGQVMPDGKWVAFEIRRLEDLTEIRVILVGVLIQKDPWKVSGVELFVDKDTLVSPEVVVGMLVRVEIEVLEDGTWKVLRIDPLGEVLLLDGCQEATAVVVSVTGTQIQLEGWPLLNLGENAQVVGELRAHSVVIVQICHDEAGNPQIVTIIIILQPDVIELPEVELPGEKVAICHKPMGKNPHVIVVSQSAVPAHLGHGDILGACP